MIENSPTPGRRTSARLFRWFVVITFGIHAGLTVVQPFLAGAYLSGLVDAIELHQLIGLTLPVIGLLQVLAAALFWRFAGGPLWPVQISSVVVLAEAFQIVMGFTGALGLHLPLGVAVVAGSVAMFAWSVAYQPVVAGPTESSEG